jgi:DNA-directed RNA polymerase subunit RPC12/RpoP
MSWSPELLFAAGVAAAAFLAGLLWLRHRGPRTRNVAHGKKQRAAPAPANLRYTCAGCSGQFTHSRRTLAARDKGAKSFYCNACNTRSLTVPQPKPWQLVKKADKKARK